MAQFPRSEDEIKSLAQNSITKVRPASMRGRVPARIVVLGAILLIWWI